MSPADAPGRHPCRRCLIAEIPGEETLAALIAAHRERIPAEERVSAPVREVRLRACKACEELNRGTCRLCGCYVEIRAEQRGKDCPRIPGFWPE